MYMCVCEYMCVCMDLCICMCVCVCICSVCMSVCVYWCVCVCDSVSSDLWAGVCQGAEEGTFPSRGSTMNK